MKVAPISYQVTRRKTSIPFRNFGNSVGSQSDNAQAQIEPDKFYNYTFAKNYYNQKLDNDGKLFEDEQSFSKVMSNPKAKAYLMCFIRERAQAELLELNNKSGLSKKEKEKEKEKVEGLKEILQAFPALAQTDRQYSSNITFGQNLTPEQKSKCHLIIHSAAAACGTFSAAMGEGAAIGADTPFLRGTQALMFLSLQNLLNVNMKASLIYAGKQYVMGSYIGVRGAQVLTSWLGIGGHVATTGTGSGAITGAVRAVNASLSTALTEKMGWGYVKSVEQNQMNPKTQAISAAIYAASMGLLHFHDDSFLDPTSYSDVQEALNKIPKENVSLLGDIMHTLTDNINLPRAGTIFTVSLMQGVLTAKNMDEAQKKEYFKNLVGIALMNTIFYETLNIPEDSVIKEDAIDAIKKIQEDLNNTPELFKEFRDIEQEIINKIHLEDLNTRDFIRQFKDKDLLINLAFTTSDMTTILADKWRKRNCTILKKSKIEAQKKLAAENQKGIKLNNTIDPAKKKELDETLNTIITKTKNDLIQKTRSNHALARIAGYDKTKALLNLSYIKPVKAKAEKEVPNILLFYGPSGSGKTAIGTAIAEDTGAKFRNKNLGMGNEKKFFDWLKSQMERAEQSYQTDKRYSIIQLNEFDGFLNDNPKLLNEFLELTNNCAKKYHTTIFLTTNNPLDINPKILDKTDVTVPMGVASKDDIKNIVQYYVNNKPIDGYNLDEITEEFEKVKPDYAYSNAQIQTIITQKLPTPCSQQDFVSIIKGTKPCISKEINNKFQKVQNQLEESEKC